MSSYASLPEVPSPTECLEPTHGPHGCQGCANCIKGKQPWYMTVKPVNEVTLSVASPIILLKVDSWVLEKWAEKDTESNMSHYCTSIQWKKHLGIEEIRGGHCLECCEDIPVEMVGAWTMHNWAHLQKYDKDMEKYNHYGAEEASFGSEIKVFS